MHPHRSSCLAGPVSAARDWWQSKGVASPPDPTTLDNQEDTPQDDDPTFRADLVARIRRQIADGTYDTPERWEKALDGLLGRLERPAD